MEVKQVSVNDILKDAYHRKKPALTQMEILDLEELKNAQREKRTEFESYLKRNRLDVKQWMRYALYEVEQHDMRRARSVFERALQIHTSYIPLWIRYIDVELKGKYVNHARNILERAVSTLPRVDKLWYKYLLLEESLQHYDIVRAIFNKWCELEPDSHAWDSYIKFETRQERYNSVRDIYSKYFLVHPGLRTCTEWIKFEKIHGTVSSTRSVFSLGIDALVNYSDVEPTLLEDAMNLIVIFAEWEATNKEMERARAIYKISIEKWPQSKLLKDAMLKFEKQHGSASSMLNTVLEKRKADYESMLQINSKDYDTWWLLIDLLEEYGSPETIKETYDKALLHNAPTSNIKDRLWQKYITLWIRYLCFLELELADLVTCSDMFLLLVNEIIPHKTFTFPNIWILYAEYEIRQENITEARKILGRSLGLNATHTVYKYYIEMETKLREFDRVRKLYENYIKYDPLNVEIWKELIELEYNLGDKSRVDEIKNLPFDGRQTIFPIDFLLSFNKSLIDFDIENQEYDEIEILQEKRLQLGEYRAEFWIEMAISTLSIPTESQLMEFEKLRERYMEENGDDQDLEFEFDLEEQNLERSRNIFERALSYFRDTEDNLGRFKIYDAYLSFEQSYGSDDAKERISKRMPEKKYRTRTENGITEEYIEYFFPDDNQKSLGGNVNTSKILALAKEWDAQNSN